MSEQIITIYTDGCCLGNPGIGGYAAILECNGREKEIFGGFRLSTNNRMELMGAIAGLEAVKKEGSTIIIKTDSEYISNAINKGSLFFWEKNNFSGKKNPDLWNRFLAVYRKHKVSVEWVRGHSGNVKNERCDTLSKTVAISKPKEIDAGYDKNNNL